MSDLSLYVQLATLVSVLTAIGGLIIAIRVYRRQTNAQIFLEYTRRYEAIMSAFPKEALKNRLNLDGDLPEQSEPLTLAVLRYLNLCSEEFYLQRRGYLAREIWLIWEDELKRMIRSALFRREWQTLRNEFSTYREFQDYVEQALKSNLRQPVEEDCPIG